MIIGIGIDQVTIKRIEKVLNHFETRFLNRTFTPTEQAYCNEVPALRTARYAKRFAAKEAFLKALGTGYRRGIRWHDMEVSNDDDGQPHLHITGVAQDILLQKLAASKEYKIHLSLSDTATDAIAMVILEDRYG